MKSIFKYIFLIIICASIANVSSFAQAQKKKLPSSTKEQKKPKTETNQPQDEPRRTVQPSQSQVDSVANVLFPNDSLAKIESPSGIDSLVTFFAEDSVVFNLRTKRMRLKGGANIDFKVQKLNSEIIEIDFNTSQLNASHGLDSANRKFGFPKFNDAGEIFFGEDIAFNFKTKRGTIVSGETQIGEGYYFGSKIKRISEDAFFVKDGYYTTCDDPNPHYYFGSPEMKMIAKDKIFLDPIIFYVEDMPIFVLPFGLFFPNKGGRQSGIIIPSFYFSKNRGVVFQDFGFYWAASDYWDTQVKFDLYTKGGYLIKNETQWVLRDIFKGSYNLQFGNTRFNPEDKYTKNWSVRLNHNHNINPLERVDVNVNFASQDFNRNTQTDYQSRIKQNMTSNASYSRSFDNGSNFSMSYQRDQNLIDKSYSQSIPINYSLPNLTPFKSLISSVDRSWYAFVRDISFNYRSNYTYSSSKTVAPETDTLHKFIYDERNKLSHSPSISISPKFGFFTITPSVSFSANNYFRKLTRTYNPGDSTTQDSFEKGFFTEYWYSMGVSVSTRVFGIADDSRPFFGFFKPSSIGVKAFRHTYQPTFGYNFTPDFSDKSYGFYGSYYDAARQDQVKYSKFIRDGGAAPSSLSQSISYNDLHSFEIKVKQGDTLPDKNIELLRLTFGASYNLAADSMNLSDINMTFRTPAMGFIEFSGSAAFTAYDETKYETSPNNYSYRRVNQYLLSNGKGLARLTNFSLSFTSTVTSSQSDFGKSLEFSAPKDSLNSDSISAYLGSRFLQRHSHDDDEYFDWYGDASPGYMPITIPWSLNAGVNFNYERYFVNKINRSLNLSSSINIKLTESWSANCNFRYDLIKMQLLTPQLNLTKDLHCWNLLLNWTPTGYNRGFYLKFGIKSSMLQDLKIEKKNSPIFR